MPITKKELQTIAARDLPDFLDQCQHEKRQSMALICVLSGTSNSTFDWFIENGNWANHDIYLLDELFSEACLSRLLGISSLQHLALDGFHLGDTGALAIAEKLRNLHTLYLGDNSVGDTGAQAIAEKLSNLHTLDLFNNKVGDAGVWAIAKKLSKLHTLHLGNNNVGEAAAGAIAEKLGNLHTLYLGYNNVGEAGALSIANKLGNLHTLQLGSNNVGEAGVEAIAEKLGNLHTLYLGYNNVGEAGARLIANKLSKLHTLDLGYNKVGKAGARAIADNLSNLHTLYIGDNNVGEAGAETIANKLSNLRTLDIKNNNVGEAGVAAIAEKLGNLQTLDLGNNNVGDGGIRAIADKLGNLQTLNLSNNMVNAIGVEAIAEKLGNLHTLHLSNNAVYDYGASAIAEWLGNLHTLHLSNNEIGDSGARAIAEKLGNLQTLDLGDNNVGEAGARAIAENLKKIRYLGLAKNHLTDDSVRILVNGLPYLQSIAISKNDALRLPKELIGRRYQIAAIRDYFRRIDAEGVRKLNEAKLIVVGNEAVGKTALVNYLVKNEPRSETEKTPGLHIEERINVSNWVARTGGTDEEPLHLNVWDFGGQEVTRETHKLFLTARSLYLVVLEARRENVDDAERVLHDWMRAIRNRGGDTVPVLVVINKSEGDQILRLDETTLAQRYPIRAFIRTSCNDPKKHPDGGKGIKELRQLILETIRQEIPQASAEFPVSYFEVKEQLRETAKTEHSFGIIEYTNICNKVRNPVATLDEQKQLLQLLVDIGVVIQHKDTTLLDPNWLTSAIYRILTHSEVVKKGGLFRVDDLETLLASIQRPEKDTSGTIRYPKDRWQYIVDQTVECGLSFEISDEPGTYLMPEQLSPNAIDTGLEKPSDSQVLRFRYDYADIPKGLMPRFIVQMHRYLSKMRTCWANGVVLYTGECKVLVQSDRQKRCIQIYVHGPQAERREALRIVREGLERVHDLFEDHGAKAMVPVNIPNKPEAAIAYSQLIDHERAGVGFEKILCEGVAFLVRELLGGIAVIPERHPEESRRGSIEIKAGDGAKIQVITGHHNESAVDQSGPISSDPAPKLAQPAWKTLLAPVLAAVFTALILGMYFAGVDAKWMTLVAVPILVGAGVYLVGSYYEAGKRYWARRYAGIFSGLAGTCLLAPGIKFLVDIVPGSKIELVLDNAVWPAAVAMLAACFFGWLQWKKDNEEVD